jgi:hypothetical protein
MDLPPGPSYAVRMLLRALPASLAAYAILHVLARYSGNVTLKWLPFAVFLVAHPIVNFVMGYWRAYQNRVDAAAHGAVLVPRVSEGGFKVRAAFVKSIQSGYPGACCIVR